MAAARPVRLLAKINNEIFGKPSEVVSFKVNLGIDSEGVQDESNRSIIAGTIH